MTTTIQNFDVTEHIRDRVRQVLIGSLPDEQMDAMIKREFDAYFADKQEYGRQIPSLFARQIATLLEEEIRAKIKAWLSSNFETLWESTGTRLIGDLVADLVPAVQEKMAHDMTERTLGALRDHL